jgi:hypothetical protein
MRASVKCEAAGVPTVSLVCEGFERQALATGRGLGLDGMRLAVLQGHVDSQSTQDMIDRFVTTTVAQVIAGLVGTGESASPEDAFENGQEVEPSATDVVVRGTIDQVHAAFVQRGWTDGHPFVPPTRARVEAMLGQWGYDPWRVLGTARPSGRDMTVWSVAVNAVMAGCDAVQLPLLMAMAEVLADPSYGVQHSGNTTGADALVIVSGPITGSMALNHGQGALREGAHANTAVGRWLRLYLRNVCGFTADEHDKATFGNSARVVLAEDGEALASMGWPSVAEEAGVSEGDGAVTIGRVNGGLIVGSVFGSTPAEIVPYLADGLVRVTGWELTHVFGLGQGQYRPLLILSPVLARIFASAGWSKDDVRSALFEHARIPAWKFESYIGAWSNLTAGRRTLFELAAKELVPAVFAESDDPNRLVPLVTSPDRFLLAVAGDPNRTNAYVMSNDGPHGMWTTKPVAFRASDDLVCAVPTR